MNSNILITGASGFIGSFLVEAALSRGYNVWASIRKSSSKEYLQDKRINFIYLDYSNNATLTAQLDTFIIEHGNIDYIIHCAGITKSTDIEDFDRINFLYTKNLLDTLRASTCNPIKVLFISSLSVMGAGDEVSFSPFDSSNIPSPNTAYGVSKLKAEQYLQASNIPYIILRPTGVYGPREKDYLQMMKSVKLGIAIKTGLTPQHLTFIYVSDLTEASFLALESELCNKTYLISDGDEYTDDEYTELVKKVLHKTGIINVRVPLFTLKILCTVCEVISKITLRPLVLNKDKYQIIKQRNWNCNINPIIADLNYKPKYNLHDGLETTAVWYKKQGWL